MKLSLEVLEHIFSFLGTHSETLIACSKDLVLSPIVERSLYRHVVFQLGDTDDAKRFLKLVSENPRILTLVRVLQVEQYEWENQRTKTRLDECAETMLKFPLLECIMLTTGEYGSWVWSDGFQAALEDCINRPTLKELHMKVDRDFPFSLVDKCKNIERLSLSGSFYPEGQVYDSTLPQLKSLMLDLYNLEPSSSLLGWLKTRSKELQSLTYTLTSGAVLTEFLGLCSETLETLDIDLKKTEYHTSQSYTSEYPDPLPEFPLAPHNLRKLIIRACATSKPPSETSIPAAAGIIRSFVSFPRNLVLDINLSFPTFSQLLQVDFSPLTVLGAASASICRIDLYIHTGVLPPALTCAALMSTLEEHEDVMKAIKEGILFIHSEKTAAPKCL